MRKAIAIVTALIAVCSLTAQTTVPPADLLQRGRQHYRAGRYAEAANDLRAAADGLLTPEQMKAYVSTGQFASLAQFETAIIYLTLADMKLGREADAREQLQRLSVAESIAPTYATLALSSEVAEFPAIAQRLMPAMQLPANTNVAAGPPAGRVPAGEPAPTSAAPMPAPATQAVSEAEQRYIDQKIAEARAEIERRAQERIDAIQKAAQQEIAAARAAAAAAQSTPVKATDTAGVVGALHKAAVQANTGQVQDANAVYLRLAAAPGASRDVIAAAAVGLYRTGDFADALQAFQKLGPFARGEEDLRYYHAVTLFETGHYEEAKKELDCALPYIEMTDDVVRYQAKIEQMLVTRRSTGSSS